MIKIHRLLFYFSFSISCLVAQEKIVLFDVNVIDGVNSNVQKDMMIKQLIQFPELYYAKSHFPLELSQRAFNHLWRMCESYELWCKETCLLYTSPSPRD